MTSAPKRPGDTVPPNGATIRIVEDGVPSARPLFVKWHCPTETGCPCPGHEAASGQLVPVDSHFQIGTERFRFPGDTHLGAAPNVAILCRCVAVFMIRPTDDGDWIEIDRTPSVVVRDESQLRPTSSMTLNGNTRGRVVLASGEIAQFQQNNDTDLRVLIDRKTVARGTISGSELLNFWIDSDHANKGIEQLMRRSVELLVRRHAVKPR